MYLEQEQVSIMGWKSVGWSVIAWACIGLAHAVSRYSDIVKYQLNVPFTYVDVFGYVSSYLLWVGITLALLMCLERFRYPFSYRALAGLFVVGLVAWLPAYFVLDKVIATYMRGEEMVDLVNHLLKSSAALIFFYTLIYALTFAVCLGVVLANNTRRAQLLNASLTQQQAESALLLSEQKMQLMQSQLSPHVLFNCLGSISALARRGERDRLVDAVAKVGNLLRFTLLNASAKTIALFDELALIDDYIALQRLRFEGRFSYTQDIQELDSDIMCPPFTLQPLVENAFKHAVELTESGVDIRVAVKQEEGVVKMTVFNTLPSENRTQKTTGTGIKNLTSRLSHLYHQQFDLRVFETDTTYEVNLTFPVKVAKHDI